MFLTSLQCLDKESWLAGLLAYKEVCRKCYKIFFVSKNVLQSDNELFNFSSIYWALLSKCSFHNYLSINWNSLSRQQNINNIWTRQKSSWKESFVLFCPIGSIHTAWLSADLSLNHIDNHFTNVNASNHGNPLQIKRKSEDLDTSKILLFFCKR